MPVCLRIQRCWVFNCHMHLDHLQYIAFTMMLTFNFVGLLAALIVKFVLGDAMIYDTGYDPWRLIKVMVNENRGDDPIIDFSWTMDCQRVITITHSVRTYEYVSGIQKTHITDFSN